MGRLIEEPKVFEIMKRHWLSGSIAHHIIDDIRNDIIKNVPTVEAIPKADYENRLKADMVAMLKEMSKQIEEEREDCEKLSNSYERFGIRAMAQRSQIVIQQKINSLKGEE